MNTNLNFDDNEIRRNIIEQEIKNKIRRYSNMV